VDYTEGRAAFEAQAKEARPYVGVAYWPTKGLRAAMPSQ
jgi:hypothetical protein